MEYNLQKSIREGLINWLYAIFYNYYHDHEVCFLKEKITDSDILYIIKHNNKNIKISAKNIRYSLTKHLLVDYYIFLSGKWQLLDNLYDPNMDAVI